MSAAASLLGTPLRRLLHVWDRASIYLPLLLMGALALGTYWLVRNSPVTTAQQAAQKPGKNEIDYFMRRFTIRSFDGAGQLKSEIVGAEGRHYADTDILEIDQPQIRALSDTGRHITSTSVRALSNGDGSEVQLLGNARVVREAAPGADGKLLPSMEFKGEFLHAFVKEERIKSHKPVVLKRGADQFTGDSFTYDNLTGIMELKGRVTGTLAGKAASPAP